MKIVVGNLSFRTKKSELKGLFAKHGNVASVRLAAVITMPDSGRAPRPWRRCKVRHSRAAC